MASLHVDQESISIIKSDGREVGINALGNGQFELCIWEKSPSDGATIINIDRDDLSAIIEWGKDKI